MPRLLIVSPRFPPINAADMHRVRQSLPYYARHGWQATVLCLDATSAGGVYDALLETALPGDMPIVRARAWRESICRRFGFGEISYRSLVPLYLAGSRLLRREKFDLVFFSTTVFLSFILGRAWKRRFGCRIVYDFQDPWYSETNPYSRETAPGGWWKHQLSRFLCRLAERFALKAGDHIVSVSVGYVEQLTRRYRHLDKAMFTVLPFGAAPEDYDIARRLPPAGISSDAKQSMRWVSVGRAGPDMDAVLQVLFETLAQARAQDASFGERLRLAFIGTNYAPPERTRPLVQPIAVACGVGDFVEEDPARIPYFDALALNLASEAILIIGSTSADYTASRLLTCVAAKKPVLALFHRRSLVCEIAKRFPNVFLATFDELSSEAPFRAKVASGIEWLLSRPRIDPAAVDAALKPWTAEVLAERQCAVFDRLLRTAPCREPQATAPPGAVP